MAISRIFLFARFFLFLLIVQGFPVSGKAQILTAEYRPILPDGPRFRAKFMRENGIKRIIGRISTKQKMDRIRSADRERIHKFDRKGRIRRVLTVRGSDDRGKKDTGTIVYRYNERGYLVTIRKNDEKGVYERVFAWDSLGRPTKKVYRRVGRDGSLPRDKRLTISSEHYEYRRIQAGVLERSYYNNVDRLYKERLIHRDSNEYVTRLRDRWVIGNRRSLTRFEYTNKGWLAAKVTDRNVSDTNRTRLRFRYDEIGNITRYDRYERGVHVKRVEYVYKGDSMLLKARIKKDVASGTLTIVNYSYVFY